MKRTLLVTPLAEAEIAAAAAWYYDIFATLATRFLDEVSVVLEAITNTPTRYPLWPGLPLVRKARLNVFPYYAVFTTDDQMINVLAMAHSKRHPHYWQRRIDPK